MKLFLSLLATCLGGGLSGCTLTGSDLEPPAPYSRRDDLADASGESSTESDPTTPVQDQRRVAVQSDVPDLEGTNLIENADAEAGLSGWTADFGGTLSLSNEQFRSGTHSVLLTGRAETYHGIHRDVTDETAQGESYSLRAFALIRGASLDTLSFTAQFACAGLDDRFQQIARATGSDARWTALAGVLRMPGVDDCTRLRATVYVEGPAPGVDLFVDDVQMVRGPPPTSSSKR